MSLLSIFLKYETIVCQYLSVPSKIHSFRTRNKCLVFNISYDKILVVVKCKFDSDDLKLMLNVSPSSTSFIVFKILSSTFWMVQ